VGQDRFQTLKDEALFTWLSTDKFWFVQSQFVSLLNARDPLTLTWVFEMEEFKSWQFGKLGLDTNILWVRGGPGVGKSTIASSVIKYLTTPTSPGTIVAFLFCKNASVGLTKVRDMVRTLAYQFARHCVDVRRDLETLKTSNFKIDETIGIRFLFNKIIKEPLKSYQAIYNDDVYVVVDGLDEADNKSVDTTERIKEIDIFLDCLTTLGSARVLLLSRPDSAVRNILSKVSVKSVGAAENANDIEGFVTRKLMDPRYSQIQNWFPKERGDPRTYFVEKCEGMFLWVSLALEQICKVKRRKAFTALIDGMLLSTIGATIDALYNSILDRVDDDEFEWVRESLLWIVVEDGISIQLLRDVVQGCLDDELHNFQGFIREQCGSMVKWISSFPNLDYVSLVHESFKMFLMDPKKCPERWLIDKTMVRTHAASEVLKLFLKNADAVDSNSASPEVVALVQYSAQSFIEHLTEINQFLPKCDDSYDILFRLRDLFTSERLGLWVRVGLISRHHLSEIGPLDVNFEEAAIDSIANWLKNYKGDTRNAQLESWKDDMVSQPSKLAEQIGKQAARLWQFYELASFDEIALCFLLSLKYYRLSVSRNRNDFGESGEFRGVNFNGIYDWIGASRSPIRKNIGVAYAVLRRWRDAIDWYTLGQNGEDEPATLAEWIGDALFELEKFPQAIDAYERALAKGSTSARLTERLDFARDTELNRYREEPHPNREQSLILWQPSPFPSVARASNSSINSTSDAGPEKIQDPGAPEGMQCYTIAVSLRKARDFPSAIAALERGIEKHCNDWNLLWELATIHKELKDYALSVSTAKRAIELYEAGAEKLAKRYLGNIKCFFPECNCHDTPWWPSLNQVFEEHLRRIMVAPIVETPRVSCSTPSQVAIAWHWIAEIYLHGLEDQEASIKALISATTKQPHCAPPCAALGAAYLKRRELNAAISAYIELYPVDHNISHANVGWDEVPATLEPGRRVKMVSEVLGAKPWILFGIALACRELDYVDLAVEVFEKFERAFTTDVNRWWQTNYSSIPKLPTLSNWHRHRTNIPLDAFLNQMPAAQL